jgi:hypothetical protein
MPRIIVQASESGGDAVRVTLSERVVASQLQDGHYAEQLLERLAWAAIDAERLEQAHADHQLERVFRGKLAEHRGAEVNPPGVRDGTQAAPAGGRASVSPSGRPPAVERAGGRLARSKARRCK